MRRDHREATVGPWAAEKLDALEAYLDYYTTVLKKWNFRKVYIDGFAGACVTKVRGTGATLEPSPFFDDAADALDQGQFIQGSPIRALSLSNPFSEYYFFDMDAERAVTLETAASGRTNVTVRVGDCNPLIRELATKLHSRSVRGVAFLDPYGAHLEWDTVVALAAADTMEVVINFPVAMAINRLIVRNGQVPERWADQLDRCFGTSEWRDVAYQQTADLFGTVQTSKKDDVSRLLLDLYVRRLRGIFKHVAPPKLIRNTLGNPLYFLLWAGQNELGLKGAAHILRKGEALGR